MDALFHFCRWIRKRQELCGRIDSEYKNGEITPEEYAQYIEHDILQSELSNIKQDYSDNGKLIYTRIIKGKKRDRATSLCYGLSVISEMENDNRKNLYNRHSNILSTLSDYTYL